MRTWLVLIGLLLAHPAFLTRLTFLAPTGLGAVFYFPSVASAFAWKRWRLRPGLVELALFGAGLLALGLAGSGLG